MDLGMTNPFAASMMLNVPQANPNSDVFIVCVAAQWSVASGRGFCRNRQLCTGAGLYWFGRLFERFRVSPIMVTVTC